jgi:hypothetical protein
VQLLHNLQWKSECPEKKKKDEGFPRFFVILVPIPNLSTFPSIPGVRELISVAIPLDPLRKKED